MGQKEKLGHQCSPGGGGSLVPGDGAEGGKVRGQILEAVRRQNWGDLLVDWM